jgi:hypothetical protein
VGDEILTGLTFKGCLGRWMIVDFPSDLPDLRRRFERLRYFLRDELTPRLRSQILQWDWLEIWVDDYHLLDAMYRWLCSQVAWVKSNPNAVLNHVLNNKLYRF